MKAWSVEDTRCTEGYVEIVFAETRGKAILASEAYGMSGVYTDMRVLRLKLLDDREDMPENEAMRLLIKEKGWYQDVGNVRITVENLAESIEAGLI